MGTKTKEAAPLSFVAELEETERRGSFRMFKALDCGRVSVSVQASRGHYSTPREILAPGAYESFEVAIIPKAGEMEWFTPMNCHPLRELAPGGSWEQGPRGVGAGVPAADVQRIVDLFRTEAA